MTDPAPTPAAIATARRIVSEAATDIAREHAIADAFREAADDHERRAADAERYALPYQEWLERNNEAVPGD